MRFGNNTRALWLRARYREGQFEGEACLLVYDDESFGDLLVSGDIKEVFERRASTANIFIAAPFLSTSKCRDAMRSGTAVRRASSYLSGKSGNVYMVELHQGDTAETLALKACALSWDAATRETKFGDPVPLDASLRENWLFDLFDSNEGLVVAPAGVHFRKSSRKHTTTFLRAANALTSSAGCGLLALFALAALGRGRPKRVLVDTAPLLSLAFALMHVAKAHGVWPSEVPARSFGSYGGLEKVGRLSASDVVLVSATTSGSLAQGLIKQGARVEGILTLYYLGTDGASRPAGVLCDLTVAADRSVGYHPVVNYPANDCRLCNSQYLLAEFEGDQFLLQQRQHRLLRVTRNTQSTEARTILTELCRSEALQVALRSAPGQNGIIAIDEARLLSCSTVKSDFIRLLRRYAPHPLALIVRVNISVEDLDKVLDDAGIGEACARAKLVDWTELSMQEQLPPGAGVLVVFGFLSSQSQARSVNASLRALVNEGNVAYLSALTLADNPEQYQDLKTFLGYGERGPDSFTYRECRRLALPGASNGSNPWESELQLLDAIADVCNIAELEARRRILSLSSSASTDIFLPGKSGPLSIQRDFVYLDTSGGTNDISQADVFTVVLNLLCVARAGDRELGKKAASPGDLIELTQSVYGHVLVSPSTFLNYNDAVLKASVLRAAKPSELMYDVDEVYSTQVSEIVIAELAGWDAGNGDALPEMLLALATGRLRLREIDRLGIRDSALKAGLPPLLSALADSIPS